MFDGALEVVPFVDAGTVDRDTVPSFGDIRFGAGVGARYYTSFGPIRLDVAVPLNREPGDNWVAVYVALGQAF
jgi:translocation and assembly module TamA